MMYVKEMRDFLEGRIDEAKKEVEETSSKHEVAVDKWVKEGLSPKNEARKQMSYEDWKCARTKLNTLEEMMWQVEQYELMEENAKRMGLR